MGRIHITEWWSVKPSTILLLLSCSYHVRYNDEFFHGPFNFQRPTNVLVRWNLFIFTTQPIKKAPNAIIISINFETVLAYVFYSLPNQFFALLRAFWWFLFSVFCNINSIKVILHFQPRYVVLFISIQLYNVGHCNSLQVCTHWIPLSYVKNWTNSTISSEGSGMFFFLFLVVNYNGWPLSFLLGTWPSHWLSEWSSKSFLTKLSPVNETSNEDTFSLSSSLHNMGDSLFWTSATFWIPSPFISFSSLLDSDRS